MSGNFVRVCVLGTKMSFIMKVYLDKGVREKLMFYVKVFSNRSRLVK